MQTLIQVICNENQWKSLRTEISKDKKLEDYDLFVTLNKKKGRKNGWAKIHSSSAYGVLNVDWNSSTKVLSARAVTRNSSKTKNIVSLYIVSLYIDYLLARHKSKIKIINILSVE